MYARPFTFDTDNPDEQLTLVCLKLANLNNPAKDKVQTLDKIIGMINSMKLKENFSTADRLHLIDTAIKVGSVEIVKLLTESYIRLGVADEIRVPNKNNREYPYRPVFWLAAIVTQQAPAKNYEEIENFLCTKFKISDSVDIGGEFLTREAYVKKINEWKIERNQALRERGRQDDRYVTTSAPRPGKF